MSILGKMDESARRYPKRIRLDRSNYCVPGQAWLITTVCHDRQPVFADDDMANLTEVAIKFTCAKAGADLLLYSVMPDHVHAIIATEEVDLITIMQRFKSYTAHQWKKRSGQSRLWQPSFHDHGIRRTEKIDQMVEYVLSNPVRAGLVDDWSKYRWIGGSLIESTDVS
jgi:REP element-mobilizing transposase RayT